MQHTHQNQAIRLPIPRHLQDFNGYCGPACAMMVVDFTGSSKSPPVFAQNDLFREVRSHARSAKDRRPVKSPAESLLELVNEHTAGAAAWGKVYHPDPHPVLGKIIRSITEKFQPCLMLVSRGMHWVVAFGLQKKDDGTPAGLLVRDPAWAGMPKFFGLSIFPDKPTVQHSASEQCNCLNACPENPSGTVHERYFSMEEVISHRGLQGSPDWNREGAIALVPAELADNQQQPIH